METQNTFPAKTTRCHKDFVNSFALVHMNFTTSDTKVLLIPGKDSQYIRHVFGKFYISVVDQVFVQDLRLVSLINFCVVEEYGWSFAPEGNFFQGCFK